MSAIDAIKAAMVCGGAILLVTGCSSEPSPDNAANVSPRIESGDSPAATPSPTPAPGPVPTTLSVTDAGVVGTYVEDNGSGTDDSMCATDNFYRLDKDKSYTGYYESGRWRIEGDRVVIVGESESEELVDAKPTPMRFSWKVTSTNKRGLSAVNEDGKAFKLYRCP